MKKILILYAKYGGGHFSTAKSLKNYLDDNYEDVETEMVDCIEYINKSLNKVTTGAYKQLAKNVPWAWKRIYYHSEKGTLSKISTTTNKVMALKLLKIFNNINPDLVISTHPFATQMTSYLKKSKKVNCKLATVMTDFMSHDQWLIRHELSNYFFVSNAIMKTALVKRRINKDKIFVTGIPISDKFSKEIDVNNVIREFDLLPNKKTILFFGGGELGLGNDSTIKLLEAFINNKNDFQIIAISGKNAKMKRHFNELLEKYGNKKIKVLEYTDKVPELMRISTLVVSKPGGLTTSESMASGVPMVIINPIPGQEEENAEFLEGSGAAIWLRKTDDPNKVVDDLMKYSYKLTEMKENAKSIAKPNATKRICNILFHGLS